MLRGGAQQVSDRVRFSGRRLELEPKDNGVAVADVDANNVNDSDADTDTNAIQNQVQQEVLSADNDPDQRNNEKTREANLNLNLNLREGEEINVTATENNEEVQDIDVGQGREEEEDVVNDGLDQEEADIVANMTGKEETQPFTEEEGSPVVQGANTTSSVNRLFKMTSVSSPHNGTFVDEPFVGNNTIDNNSDKNVALSNMTVDDWSAILSGAEGNLAIVGNMTNSTSTIDAGNATEPVSISPDENYPDSLTEFGDSNTPENNLTVTGVGNSIAVTVMGDRNKTETSANYDDDTTDTITMQSPIFEDGNATNTTIEDDNTTGTTVLDGDANTTETITIEDDNTTETTVLDQDVNTTETITIEDDNTTETTVLDEDVNATKTTIKDEGNITETTVLDDDVNTTETITIEDANTTETTVLDEDGNATKTTIEEEGNITGTTVLDDDVNTTGTITIEDANTTETTVLDEDSNATITMDDGKSTPFDDYGNATVIHNETIPFVDYENTTKTIRGDDDGSEPELVMVDDEGNKTGTIPAETTTNTTRTNSTTIDDDEDAAKLPLTTVENATDANIVGIGAIEIAEVNTTNGTGIDANETDTESNEMEENGPTGSIFSRSSDNTTIGVDNTEDEYNATNITEYFTVVDGVMLNSNNRITGTEQGHEEGDFGNNTSPISKQVNTDDETLFPSVAPSSDNGGASPTMKDPVTKQTPTVEAGETPTTTGARQPSADNDAYPSVSPAPTRESPTETVSSHPDGQDSGAFNIDIQNGGGTQIDASEFATGGQKGAGSSVDPTALRATSPSPTPGAKTNTKVYDDGLPDEDEVGIGLVGFVLFLVVGGIMLGRRLLKSRNIITKGYQPLNYVPRTDKYLSSKKN